NAAGADRAEGDADAAAINAANEPTDIPRVTLLGSGAILTEVIMAAEQLAERGIASDVYSVTSWSELARDGQRCESPEAPEAKDGGKSAECQPHITQLLAASQGPIVA